MSTTLLVSVKEAKRQYFLSSDDLNRLPYEKQRGRSYWNNVMTSTKCYRRAHLHQAALRKYGMEGFAEKQRKSQQHNMYQYKKLSGDRGDDGGEKYYLSDDPQHPKFGVESVQTSILDDSIISIENEAGDDVEEEPRSRSRSRSRPRPNRWGGRYGEGGGENEDPNSSHRRHPPRLLHRSRSRSRQQDGGDNGIPIRAIDIQRSSSTLKSAPTSVTDGHDTNSANSVNNNSISEHNSNNKNNSNQQIMDSVQTLRNDIRKQFKHVLTWDYLRNKNAPLGTLGTARLMRVEWYEFAALLGQHVSLDEVKSVLKGYYKRNLAYTIDVPYVYVMGETHGLTGRYHNQHDQQNDCDRKNSKNNNGGSRNRNIHKLTISTRRSPIHRPRDSNNGSSHLKKEDSTVGGERSRSCCSNRNHDHELGLDPKATLKLKYNPSGKMLSVTGFVCPISSHQRTMAGRQYSKFYHDDDTISSDDDDHNDHNAHAYRERV